MLHNLKELYGNKLAALDGDIGHVRDFYFDDKTWVIRYVVAETGSWLTGRLVVLSPHSFGRLDPHDKILDVKLHKKQIENSPSIDSHAPVSRHFEIECHRYYGWPAYWNDGASWILGGYPEGLPPSKDKIEEHPQQHGEDKHLQSSRQVTGYHIQATDGLIGHVRGFLVDEMTWAIRELAVEAGHWYSGREILISPGKIERIRYEESTVFVNLTKADIQRTGESEVAQAGVGHH
jgi:hypothetical protein